MMTTATLESALRSSVFMLATERRRLEEAILAMERQMAAAMTEPEARTLAERKAALNQALAEVERQQEAAREAEAQRRAEAAAVARRAALSGNAAKLADAHDAKLSALGRAEAAMAEMVSAANDALRCEAAERAAAAALVQHLGVERTPLSFSREETARRLTGGICSYLVRLSVCRLRQLSYLPLPDNPHTRDAAGWAEREAKATAGSVELLVNHSEIGAKK